MTVLQILARIIFVTAAAAAWSARFLHSTIIIFSLQALAPLSTHSRTLKFYDSSGIQRGERIISKAISSCLWICHLRCVDVLLDLAECTSETIRSHCLKTNHRRPLGEYEILMRIYQPSSQCRGRFSSVWWGSDEIIFMVRRLADSQQIGLNLISPHSQLWDGWSFQWGLNYSSLSVIHKPRRHSTFPLVGIHMSLNT